MKRMLYMSAILVLLLLVSSPMKAEAVSYPVLEEDAAIRNKAVFDPGSIVYLFESGTAEVRQSINVNDILTVYRISNAGQLQEVGKIKKILLFFRTLLPVL